MSNLTTFTFAPANANVRTVTIDGNPWFVAKDVCLALNIHIYNGKVNTTDALQKLAADEKRNEGCDKIQPWPFDARAKSVWLVSESGLYKLILRAHPNVNPMVRKFQDWVTREVLPAIRKDGMYVLGEEKVRTGEVSEDEFILRAYDLLRAKVERLKAEKEKLEAENTSMGEVIGAHMHTVARFCRTIPGINTNTTKRDLLREGYLYRQGGTYRVYRKHADLFEEKFNEEYGTVDIYLTEKGKRLLLDLNRQGKLTKLKRAA